MGPESDVRMPLTAHLEELRSRLIRMIAAVTVAALLAWLVIEHLVDFLLAPLQQLRPGQSLIIGTGVTEAFFTKLKVAVIGGIFVSSPVLFYQAWRFIAPGLYDREKRVALPFSIAASVFFIAGASFCYWLVFPVAFQFFLQEFASIGVEAQIRVSEYLSFASRMLLAFGATFELPVVTFFLARIGLVTHKNLIAWWRYAIVVIFVVAAVLTPGPDVASQMLMAAPLLVLYVLSIGVAYMVARPAVVGAEAPPSDDVGPPTPG
jgi:sec-independent protein translocase protein TatC